MKKSTKDTIGIILLILIGIYLWIMLIFIPDKNLYYLIPVLGAFIIYFICFYDYSKPKKTHWNKQEVEKLCRNAYWEGVHHEAGNKSRYYTFDKWIEENLL